MAIFQGGNAPIIAEFDEDMTNVPGISCGLYVYGTEQKHWEKDDAVIDGNIVSFPMTQEESAAFTPGQCEICIKTYASDGSVIMYAVERDCIVERDDREHRFSSEVAE